jgi:glutaminyl-peptide cyclotransferase
MILRAALFLSILLLISCTSKKEESVNDFVTIPYTMVKAFPHDVTTFTQGLTVHNGELYESTGQKGSWISQVEITTGTQNKKVVLDNQYFGEGITILNNKMYQLTWQSKVGFVYDLKDFAKLKEFHYNHEGWGITSDNKSLIVSDGTDRLHFLDTLTLQETSVVSVKENGKPMEALNELEFVDGFIYANQWQTPYILKIEPGSGEVVGRMDLSALLDRIRTMNPNADVLNGIAYEKKSKTLLVTGKYWPVLFALRFKENSTPNSNL